MENTINWLSKLQAADKISGSTFGYSENAIRLAKKEDKHISIMREGKGFIETIDSVGHFPKIKYFEAYIKTLKTRLEHIRQNEPDIKEDNNFSMNETCTALIRMLAGIANEVRIHKQ